MYHKRLNGYASIGYKAKGESIATESINVIFDKSNFLSVYTNDIMNAAREILIVSPFVTKKRSIQMMQYLRVQAAKRIVLKHPSVSVHPYSTDMNTFFERERPDCVIKLAIAGVDSAEHRRQLALKLPKRVVNMWTENDWVGAARFGFRDGWPCLYCAYPMISLHL